MSGPAVRAAAASTISFNATAIAQIKSVDGLDIEVGEVETSNLATTVAKTFRPTLYDPGEVDFTIQWDPSDTTHTALTTALGSPALQACVVTFGGTTHTATFNAFVKGFKVNTLELEGNIEAEVKLRISGPVTFA